MVNPIPLNNLAANKIVSDQAPSKPIVQPEVAPVKTDTPKEDVVQLSNAAQAKLLKQEGLTISEIAIKLGLDVKTVSTYFPSVSTQG